MVGFLSLVLFFQLCFSTLHLGFHPALYPTLVNSLVLWTSNLLCGDYANEYVCNESFLLLWLVQTALMVSKKNHKEIYTKFIKNLSDWVFGFQYFLFFSRIHPEPSRHEAKWKIFKYKLKLYSHINWILKFPKFQNLSKINPKFTKFKIFPIKTQKSPTQSICQCRRVIN